jgi:hypothetical protein
MQKLRHVANILTQWLRKVESKERGYVVWAPVYCGFEWYLNVYKRCATPVRLIHGAPRSKL